MFSQHCYLDGRTPQTCFGKSVSIRFQCGILLTRVAQKDFMQNLELNIEEMEILRDILQHNLSELEVEVFRTDTHEFKERLKQRRGIIEQILKKLAVPAPAV